jgi:hypothetical protein
MGGDYYDRPVVSVSSNIGVSYGNSVVGKSNKLNPALDPKNFISH